MLETAEQQQEALLLDPKGNHASGKPWVIRNGEKKTIGRKAECDIVVNDTIVSGLHCIVGLSILSPQERQGDGIVISVEDKSTNGTLINGERIGKGKTRFVQAGDVINLGKPKTTAEGEHQYAASYKLRMVVVDGAGQWRDEDKENRNMNSDGSTEAPVGTPRSAPSTESNNREAVASVPRLRNFPVNGKRAREPPTALRRREPKTSSAAAMAAAHREEQLRGQLAAAEEGRRKEEARATELEIRVRVTEERLKSLNEQLEEARKAKDRYQEENADLQNQVAELTIRGKQLEAAAESKDRALQDAQRDAGIRSEDMENLRAEAFDADSRARDAARRLREVRRNLDGALEANRKLTEYSNGMKEKVSGLQSALTASAASVASLHNAIVNLYDTSQEHSGLDVSKVRGRQMCRGRRVRTPAESYFIPFWESYADPRSSTACELSYHLFSVSADSVGVTGRKTYQVESLLLPVPSPPSPPQTFSGGISPTEQTYDEGDQTDTDDEVETVLTNAATLDEDGDVTPRPTGQIRVKQSDSDSDTSGQGGTETPPPAGKRMRSSSGGSPSSQKRLRKDSEKPAGATFGDLLGNDSE